MFKAIMLTQGDDRSTHAAVQDVAVADLPQGDVEIEVAYSTVNYKDALAITGASPVVRKWPMVPGIDLTGTVRSSSDSRFTAGQEVVINGHGMGELHWGGLAQRARVPADWITRLPQGVSMRDAMSVGTAGYTAALCVLALQRAGVKPEDGPVLVTGANGGVGSFAVALLAALGFEVTASTGRIDQSDRLKKLGASELIDRNTLSEKGRALQKETWAGAVDCVGSHTLANVCAQMRYGGVVAACGLAQGMDLPATVAPFILRGVTLAGVDSVYAPAKLRDEAWALLARETNAQMREGVSEVITLAQAIEISKTLLDGQVLGRVIVDVGA